MKYLMKLESFTESKTYIKIYENFKFKEYVLIKIDVGKSQISPYYILHVSNEQDQDNESITYDKYYFYDYVNNNFLIPYNCKNGSSTMLLENLTILMQTDTFEECKEYLDLILKTEKYNL